MKCPNCGANLAEDKLYCEKCGTEFQIVPDMDVNVASEMDDTLSDIALKEFGHDNKKSASKKTSRFDDMEYDDDPTILGLLMRNPKTAWIFYLVVLVVLVVLISVSINLSKNMSKEKSKDYQIELANQALADNDLEAAIKALENAYKADKSDYDLLFNIADYYYTLNRNDDALFTLKEIALNADFSFDVRETAYKKMISLYKNENRFEDISKLLAECEIGTVVNAYEDYLSNAPVFSYESGTYKETIALKLSAEGEGTIYYTIDGTVPTDKSEVYEAPIFLEYGSYTIQAFFKNKYGVSSEVIKANYLIDVSFSFEPDVLTESGEYTSATLIEVDVPIMYTVYYTSDGSTPDKTSNKYMYPFAMPLGDSEFKFISYASDGTESEVVTKNYSLNYASAISPADAVTSLVNGLVERGYIVDDAGHNESYSGRYLYIYVAPYPIENVGDVYLVVEYFEDAAGNTTKTNNIYGINVNTNELYKVQASGQGTYMVTNL